MSETTIREDHSFKEKSNKPKRSTHGDEKKPRDTANQKRPGTAGISGQLYESKLLALLLHRARNDKDIVDFCLGSNIEEVGAFDDIVFKYNLKNEESPKMFFVQAKHRNNPIKDKITDNCLLKSKNDFNLFKYFESYMVIRKKFKTIRKKFNINIGFHTLDCSFLIYTPAFEDCSKKKLFEVKGKENLLMTGNNGKTFKYDYKTCKKVLFYDILSARAISLATAFAKKINIDDYIDMMKDELISRYHVFLYKNVIKITSVKKEYLEGEFQHSFIHSDNETLVLMRETMKKILQNKNLECKINLPIHFGNSKLSLTTVEYTAACKILNRVMQNAIKPNRYNNIVVFAIDDNMIGRSKSIINDDIINIGKLVGETLVVDEKTGLLKFTIEKPSLSKYNEILLNILETEIDILENLRFDINVKSFPQLSLINEKHLDIYIKDFFNKLIFCTNQAKENDVEIILKNEMYDCYTAENRNMDTLYEFKRGALYSIYHNKVLNWWKNQDRCLTETCTFYEDAKNNILEYPVVNLSNYFYTANIDSHDLTFTENAVDLLKLTEFLNSDNAGVLLINTKSTILTSIKTRQYFKDHNIDFQNVKFVDLCNNEIVQHFRGTIETSAELVVVKLNFDMADHISIINSTVKLLKYTKIIIMKSYSISKSPHINFEYFEQNDTNNSLLDLDENSINKILQKNIIFQGDEVSLGCILEKNVYSLVNEVILDKIIKDDIILVGQEPKFTESYYESEKCYIKRKLIRRITFTSELITSINDFVIKRNDEPAMPASHQNDRDLIIISHVKSDFDEAIKRQSNINIHWLTKYDTRLLWNESHGCIRKLMQFRTNKLMLNFDYYYDEFMYDQCVHKPKSLKDLKDKVIIINSEPGMGKSILMTHLMRQSKLLNKSMCVLKINLIGFSDEFSKLENLEAEKKMKYFVLMLYHKSFSNYSADLFETKMKKRFKKAADFCDYTTIDHENKIHLNDEKYMVEENHLFEFKVFLHLYNNCKISFIFDGFDEICPNYKKEAIDLFKMLSSQVERLWITSRSYNTIVYELENEMNSFSYYLKGFSKKNQYEYLKKFNELRLIDDQTFTSHLSEELVSSTELIETIIYKTLRDMHTDFISIPLHLRYVAETHLVAREFHSDLPEKTDFELLTFYKNIIDMKFYHIRFEEKNEGLCIKNCDLKKILESQHSCFIENHKKLAAFALFKSDDTIFYPNDLKKIDALIEEYKTDPDKTGIIESITNNKPIFMHYTFAEYFASEFLFDKLQLNYCSAPVWNYLIDNILFGNIGVTNFIGAHLENDEMLSRCTSKCLGEVLITKIQSETIQIYLNCFNTENYPINVFLLLMESMVLCVDFDNYFDNFIDFAKRNLSVMPDNILEVFQRIEYSKLKSYFCDSSDSDALDNFLRLDAPDKRALELLLENKYSNDLTKLLIAIIKWIKNYNIVHFKAFWSFFTSKKLNKLSREQHMLVFSTKTIENKILAHYSAEVCDSYEFFELMLALVGKKDFRKICTYTDVNGVIPLRYFFQKTFPFIHNEYKIELKKQNMRYIDASHNYVYNHDFKKLNDLYVSLVDKIDILRFGSLCTNASINFSVEDGIVVLKDSDNPYCMW